MIEKGFVTRAEWKAHIQTHPLAAHGIWSKIKVYVPGWGYSKAEIDSFFEGYDGGKAQVDAARVIGLTQGSIPFADAGGALTEDNPNLFWNAALARLGVHETDPKALQHITGGGTIPALCLESGAEGELVTPDGQQFRIGHWNGVDTFTERLRIDDAGVFYVSYLTTGAVLFAGANGEMKQDINNFTFEVGNSRLGLNLGGGFANETLELAGNLRLDGTSYSLLCNYVGAGREILSLRAKSGLGDGSGINLYGDGDSAAPGQIKFFTNNLTAMTIDFAQLTTVKDLSISTPVNIYNLSHDAFADWVAAKHYDWTNETHDFLTTGTSTLYGDILTDRWLNQTSNTFIGVDICGSGNLAHAAGNEGYYNTGLGNLVLEDITTGYHNVAIGYQASLNVTTGVQNVAIGSFALYTGTDPDNSVAIGVSSLQNTTGDGNLAMGYAAMYGNTSGANNVAIGNSALYHPQTGGYNIAIGGLAGYGVLNNSFEKNVLIGGKAGQALTTGSFNFLMGYQTGDNLTTGSYNIIIGYDLLASAVDVNYELNIGNSLYGELDTHNIGIAQLAFGANATNTYAQATGVAPTTSPADAFQMYSADIVAGHAAAHIRNENNTIIKLYQQALIADPAGQANDLDSEARTAINAILDLLENNGLMANA